MGLMISSQINMGFIEYLKSIMRSGQDTYTVDKYVKSFFLNGSPTSPVCQIYLRNLSIEFPDQLKYDEAAAMAGENIKVETARIKIDIGEASFRCDDLGYVCRVSGKIQIVDVNIVAELFPSYDGGFKINDIRTKIVVKQIESNIKLSINGNDHSPLANGLLSTDNPELANTILNALLVLQKIPIIEFVNTLKDQITI